MKKSTKITFISIAAGAVILIAAIIIALVRMGGVESNLYGLWEKENDDGYTDSVAFGDDGSVLLVYGADEEVQYQGTWEKGSTSSGVTKINITVDTGDGIELTMYMKRYHGKYILLSDDTDTGSAFTKTSDLSVLDDTSEPEN